MKTTRFVLFSLLSNGTSPQIDRITIHSGRQRFLHDSLKDNATITIPGRFRLHLVPRRVHSFPYITGT